MTKIKDLVEKYGNREIDEVELEKILKPVKVKTIYDLEYGDTYYYISTNGLVSVSLAISEWDNDSIDNQRLSVGNVFLTREDCEFEIEYLKVKAELKRYASMCETEVDWSNEAQVKYALRYDYNSKFLDIRVRYITTDSDIFFINRSILEQAIKEIGEERIKKYYLGVKGEDK